MDLFSNTYSSIRKRKKISVVKPFLNSKVLFRFYLVLEWWDQWLLKLNQFLSRKDISSSKDDSILKSLVTKLLYFQTSRELFKKWFKNHFWLFKLTSRNDLANKHIVKYVKRQTHSFNSVFTIMLCHDVYTYLTFLFWDVTNLDNESSIWSNYRWQQNMFCCIRK